MRRVKRVFPMRLPPFDSRIFWGIRHLVYKVFAGQLRGIGYIGKPIFFIGCDRFYAGNKFGLFPGARIEVTSGIFEIGDNVRIGHNLFVSCASSLKIGNDVTISANVFISTTENRMERENLLPFSDWPVLEMPVVIGDNCFIGYGAAILPGTKLGVGCVVGANAVVRGEYPNGTVIAPAKSQLLGLRSWT
jgi:acetyltransferase-like isoleucine patch superfamily enzyme